MFVLSVWHLLLRRTLPAGRNIALALALGAAALAGDAPPAAATHTT